MNRSVICFAIWGDGYIKEKWYEWYKDMTSIMEKTGHLQTHIGIKSKSYMSGKILSVNRKGKEIVSRLSEGEIPENMSCYSLPKDFRTATFDANCACARDKSFVFFEINEIDYCNVNEQLIISLMKKYIAFETGEIYRGMSTDCPMIYTLTNRKQRFISYELIKKIE